MTVHLNEDLGPGSSRTFNLFVDDERDPPRDDTRWVVCRSVDHACALIVWFDRCPDFISFDHDLGPDCKEGIDLARWLVNRDLDQNGSFIPRTFDWYCHSQNPVGAENIEKLLSSYLRFKSRKGSEHGVYSNHR